MNIACTVEYTDTADVLGSVTGALILTESKPAKGTIMEWTVTDSAPSGTPQQFDLLENAEVHENTDGTYRIVADSMRAEGSFGVGNSKVTLRVVPR